MRHPEAQHDEKMVRDKDGDGIRKCREIYLQVVHGQRRIEAARGVYSGTVKHCRHGK